MINADLGHVTSVEEFHKEIRRQQEEAHGEDYCAIHDAITKYMKDCKSYMELGTHQGGTASAALLCKPKRVHLVDKDLSRYNRFLKPLAEKYVKENNIEFTAKQVDSRSLASTEVVDMLMIDSYHQPHHMMAELNTHGNNVTKYIIAHDTSIINSKPNDGLYQVLKTFGERAGWEVVEHCTDNVGYTVIKKK